MVLHQEGYDPTVYERASALDPAEAGVVIGTNGMRVLDHIGVAPSVTEAGQSIERARILDANGRTLTTLDVAVCRGPDRTAAGMPTNREEVRDDDLGKATNGRYYCTDGGTKLGSRDRDDSGAFVETYPESEFTDALDDLGGFGSTRDRNRRHVKRSIGFV